MYWLWILRPRRQQVMVIFPHGWIGILNTLTLLYFVTLGDATDLEYSRENAANNNHPSFGTMLESKFSTPTVKFICIPITFYFIFADMNSHRRLKRSACKTYQQNCGHRGIDDCCEGFYCELPDDQNYGYCFSETDFTPHFWHGNTWQYVRGERPKH